METIGIHKLLPGHIVGEAVKNARGAVLCPAGYTLSEQAIARLRDAGVRSVQVRNAGKGTAGDERVAAMEERFSGVTDPALLHIRDIVRKRLNKQKLEKQPG